MKIAIEGCAHGELDKIYECLQLIERREGYKVDLLICCGDFQSVRNNDDLSCMAVPLKYQQLCSFYKYYSGEKQAPVLTLFIGGNHEASNYLQELPYGGWVAPNIYYIGRCGVVNFGCLRIVGLSGIYKNNDYLRGLWEVPPYSERSKRSVYHIRSYDIFRLRQLTPAKHCNGDKSQLVMLSHDWPLGIVQYGDKEELLKRKPFFKDDLETGQLGSRPATDLLMLLKPHYWFAAHLHVKFPALVPHEDKSITEQIFTRFLALDKCLPKRRHLQLLEISDPGSEMETPVLKYDAEWMAILRLTNHLLSVKDIDNHMPGPGGVERYKFTPTDSEKEEVISLMGGDLIIRPDSFVRTAPVHEEGSTKRNRAQPTLNPQTVNICNKLNIDDPVQLVLARSGKTLNLSTSTLEASISDTLDTTGEYSDCSGIFSPQRTAKLSLPAPITPCSKVELQEEVTEKRPKLSPVLEQAREVLGNNKSPSKSDEIEPDFCSTPSVTKKSFKRRNQQLYVSNCEDVS